MFVHNLKAKIGELKLTLKFEKKTNNNACIPLQ